MRREQPKGHRQNADRQRADQAHGNLARNNSANECPGSGNGHRANHTHPKRCRIAPVCDHTLHCHGGQHEADRQRTDAPGGHQRSDGDHCRRKRSQTEHDCDERFAGHRAFPMVLQHQKNWHAHGQGYQRNDTRFRSYCQGHCAGSDSHGTRERQIACGQRFLTSQAPEAAVPQKDSRWFAGYKRQTGRRREQPGSRGRFAAGQRHRQRNQQLGPCTVFTGHQQSQSSSAGASWLSNSRWVHAR